MTTEYFFKRKDRKDGFRHRCKVCEGSKYTPIPKYGYRYCSICQRELPATDEYFYPNKAISTGLRSECRECTKNYVNENRDKINQVARLRYSNNKEEILKRCKIYYRNNIEKIKVYREETKEDRKMWRIKNKERISNAKKIYYKENKEKIQARQKEYNDKTKENKRLYDKVYRVKNRDKNTKVMRAWRKNNPERNRLIAQRRRALLNEAICDYTVEEWEACLKYFDYKDAYTGLDMDFITQDHVIPISKGGNHTKSNIVPCDIRVNSSKNNSDFMEWYQSQTFYSEERKNKIMEYIRM